MPITCPYCGSENHGNRKTCWNCGRAFEAFPPGSRTVAGAVGGALLGAAVGGPAGAAIGFFLGAILGSSAEEEEDEE